MCFNLFDTVSVDSCRTVALKKVRGMKNMKKDSPPTSIFRTTPQRAGRAGRAGMAGAAAARPGRAAAAGRAAGPTSSAPFIANSHRN